MLYSILIYAPEAEVDALSEAELAARVERHVAFQEELRSSGQLGPVARLEPTGSATTLRPGASDPVVLDGPFAETKEQLVGFYVLECASREEAVAAARKLPLEDGSLEIRPIGWFDRGT